MRTTEATALRPGLEPLPERMRKLPVDDRGYPVPWFVDWIDDKPEFRAMDPRKYSRAVREQLCWVCGQKLGARLAFTAGAMCAINRTSAEPPSHLDCARWSARNCPFLSKPHMVRRENDLPEDCTPAGGVPIMRNPGVALVWVTRSYQPVKDGRGGVVIHMGDPEAMYWYAEGRAATRAEVLASIESGFPLLLAADGMDPDTLEWLQRRRAWVESEWLPK